jgi:photosystem II stability/assembly factor-like uncharacterized protein
MHGAPGEGLHGPVCLIQADPHHKGTLLAGTRTARLFRSRDGGATWSTLSFPGELRSSLHAMLIDPAVQNVYWVAVSSEMPELAGVYRSADAGATWERVRGLQQKQVWALAFWKANATIMAAGTEDGVFLTRDGGQSWTLLAASGTAGPHPVVSLAFDPGDSNILYAGTPHLAWKTVDGGTRWLPIHKGMEEDSDIFALDVDARRRARLFAGACSGIYRSADGGGTWSSLERSLGGPIRTYVVARAPDRPDKVYAATSVGLIVSRDNGASWYRLTVESARGMAFDPADARRIFVATDQGVVRIEDGATEVRLTAGVGEKRRMACASGSAPCSP